MAERSFKAEVEDLRLGEGETFTGEGILAITKALLENGVGYVGGLSGSTHLAPHGRSRRCRGPAGRTRRALRGERQRGRRRRHARGVRHYPIRGPSPSRARSASTSPPTRWRTCASGVNGGALVIVGEDYGEGSSIMQERTHAFAMKSQFWLLDRAPTCPRS